MLQLHCVLSVNKRSYNNYLTFIYLPDTVYLVSDNIKVIIQKIRDYQNFLMLHREFICELERAGGETSELKKDMVKMENRIQKLKLKYRDYL